jgi:hypothetical protein
MLGRLHGGFKNAFQHLSDNEGCPVSINIIPLKCRLVYRACKPIRSELVSVYSHSVDNANEVWNGVALHTISNVLHLNNLHVYLRHTKIDSCEVNRPITGNNLHDTKKIFAFNLIFTIPKEV